MICPVLELGGCGLDGAVEACGEEAAFSDSYACGAAVDDVEDLVGGAGETDGSGGVGSDYGHGAESGFGRVHVAAGCADLAAERRDEIGVGECGGLGGGGSGTGGVGGEEGADGAGVVGLDCLNACGGG